MSAAQGGLLGSARRLLATSLRLVQVRLDLLATELQLGAGQVFDAVLLALLAGLGLGVGLVLLCGWILLMLQEPYRLAALGTMALVFLGAGLALVWAARRRLRGAARALDGTRGELARDIQALGPRAE
jgi:uncharacterized membrane protein YqjE